MSRQWADPPVLGNYMVHKRWKSPHCCALVAKLLHLLMCYCREQYFFPKQEFIFDIICRCVSRDLPNLVIPLLIVTHDFFYSPKAWVF